MDYIAAIAILGASKSGQPVNESGTKGTYKFTVQFAKPFDAAPVVLATPLQGTNYTGDIADTFAITITSVTKASFTVNVNRVDALNSGWDQDLRLQYMASTSS